MRKALFAAALTLTGCATAPKSAPNPAVLGCTGSQFNRQVHDKVFAQVELCILADGSIRWKDGAWYIPEEPKKDAPVAPAPKKNPAPRAKGG